MNNLTNQNALAKNGGCLKKGSSLNNWENMFIIPSAANTTPMGTKHLCQINLQVSETLDPAQSFIDQFLVYHSKTCRDKGLLSHAKTTLKMVKKSVIINGNYEDFFSKIKEPDFVTVILRELAKTKSLRRKKTILRKFYLYYFDYFGYNPLDPLRVSILRQIDNFSKRAITKYNPQKDTHPLLHEYIAELDEKNYKIQKLAKTKIGVFLKWAVENRQVSASNPNEINIKEISVDTLFAFKKHLESRIYQKSISKETAQIYIQMLRNWFTFLLLQKHIFRDPCAQLKNFNVKRKKEFRLLDLEEVKRFFVAILENGKDVLRDFSLFATMASLGVRAHELLSLSRLDVNLSDGEIKIVRKGGKEQVLPLPSLAWLLMDLYIKSTPVSKDSPVWLNDIGRRMRYDSARTKFHYYMEKAGLKEDIGACHFFRHLLFSELALNGIKLEAIKDLAGHESIRQTSEYISVRQRQVKENFKNKFKTIGADLYN